MARITKPPQFSFDDSLVLLNRRQDPLTQTQRGNYEWTWAQAKAYARDSEDNIIRETAITVTQDSLVTALMFGADVPQLAFYIAEEADQGEYNAGLLAFFQAVQLWTVAINTWGATQTPALTPVVVPAPPANAPILCTTRVNPATRPGSLPAPWGAIVDAGQGSLVSVTYTNAAAEQTFAQGFPLLLEDLVCVGGSEAEAAPATSVRATLTVGYESQLNHGLATAKQSGEGVNAQTGYTPILLARQDYSPAIYAAGNVIAQGLALLVVVGLWDNYTPPVTP